MVVPIHREDDTPHLSNPRSELARMPIPQIKYRNFGFGQNYKRVL